MDGCDSLRAELSVLRAGLATRSELNEWSIPKLQLWSILAQEALLNEVLVQAGAVWEPRKVQDMIDDLKRRLLNFGRTEAAPDHWETVTERLARGGLIVSP